MSRELESRLVAAAQRVFACAPTVTTVVPVVGKDMAEWEALFYEAAAAIAALTASPQAAPEGEIIKALDRVLGEKLEAENGDDDLGSTCVSAAYSALAFCEKYADAIRRLASPQVQGGEARKPDGYHYVYPHWAGGTIIRMSHGEEVNGARPIKAIPYWYERPPATPQRAPGVDALRSAFYMVSPRNLTANEFVDKVRALEAALASGPSGVDGWVRVPREPTQAMRDAGQAAHHEAEEAIHAGGEENWTRFGLRAKRAAHVYEAMIAAAAQDQGEG
jgi:hypothetical protein